MRNAGVVRPPSFRRKTSTAPGSFSCAPHLASPLLSPTAYLSDVSDDSQDQSGGGPARSQQLQGSSTDQANGTGVRSHSSLPATASDLPLVYAIGVTAACAWLVLRAYRIRGAH